MNMEITMKANRISTVLMLASVLLSGCAADNPMLGVGTGVSKLGEAILEGKRALMSDLSHAQAADQPYVSTRRVSKGNPGQLYGGYVQTPIGRYRVLLTLQGARMAHATYPELECSSNLMEMRGGARGVRGFQEHVYLDTQNHCTPSDRIELRESRNDGYSIRTYSAGAVSGEGMLTPIVVPVPDELVGTWRSPKTRGFYTGSMQVVLAQDGQSYTDFRYEHCNDRSVMAFQNSGRSAVAGYQAPSECDHGGYVVYTQAGFQRLKRTSYTPDGRVSQQVELSKVDD